MLFRRFAALVLGAFGLVLVAVESFAQPAQGITRETYENIGGNAVANLTSHPSYPNSPTVEEVLTNLFEAPVNYAENYGMRLRALITAPVTGEYTFWMASDDNGELWLSTDATAANRVLIARVTSWTASREWTKETNQQSAPITLQGGQQYYIEALMKEGGGGDNLAVRWRLPNGTIEEPIPASRCTPVGVSAPVFTQQPASTTVVEGNEANFTMRIMRSFGATLQWQRNGTNIPGANGTNLTVGPVTLGDGGSSFRCIASNLVGSTTSSVAFLTVVPDSTPPTINSVGNLGDNDMITVAFSEPVEASSATAAGNYAINQGVSVLSAAFGVDSRTVVLVTTPLTANQTYTLTVNNVRDRAQAPNTIAPNTQRTFSISTRPLEVGILRPGAEPIGPSTRRGGLVISEVMYHPTNRFDGRNIEFIEVYNANPWFEELGGWRITGAIEYTFPSNFVLGARSFAVVAANPADVQAVYGRPGVLGPWEGALQNSEGTLRLRNPQGAIFFEMDYTGEPPFPPAADGAGHSLVLARPSYGERDARAWAASDVIGGTPGTNEVAGVNAYRAVMINEFLAHTDAPDVDYIELYNYSSASLNIAGCVLTDDPETNKFVVPAGTVIPANGFLVFYQANLGFALGAGGETIYLKNPQGTRVIDAVRFDAQENGVATGRWPDGAPAFHRLDAKTPGANNARPRTPIVVINEIMFDPLLGDAADEYIELFNPHAQAVEVSKWRIRDAVKFTIPTGTVIPARGYLVIAANSARLRTNHTGLTTANCVGDWEGSLRNRGERVALTMPDTIVNTNAFGQLTTNTIHIVVDEVTYRGGGRWDGWAAGGGSSLELRDWRADRRLAPNWAASDETGKSAWMTVEATGNMDHGWAEATQLHVTLLGEGECLVDNIEVLPSGGGNRVSNWDFESGTHNWVFQGNHNRTVWRTNEGFNSARSLHLRTTGRGDSGANRVRTQLTSPLSGGTVTLRAKVRWLRGNPNILLRIRGNHMEAPGFTLTARNLGTPGAANSVATTNAPPAITDVAHYPPLPAANQAVLVTARVADPDGLATLLLKYRVDPVTNFTALAMTNNGAGVFSAMLPGASAGTTVAFHIVAADRRSPTRGATFPDDAPERECVVRWGDTTIPGTLGTYRFWLTQKVIDQWVAEEKMSNRPKDTTFIYGTNRIVYNAGAWFHGSPYHSPAYNSPVGAVCDYDMRFPGDDELLGETDINLFRPGNGGGDGSAQREIQAHWFARQFGIPHLNHRPVFVYVNGALRGGVYHDAQQPNGDFVEQFFPDDAEGELHKIQLGFEFGDTAYGAGEAGYAVVGANLGRYLTTGGAFKTARYRATWPHRSAPISLQHDYSTIFAAVNATLTTAAIGSEAYTATLSGMFDVREWYKVHVTQHLYNNTDSFSYGGGQNAFAYKPVHDTWKLLLWDVDFAFGGNASDANLFGIGGADHGPRNDHPPFARIYWQTLIEAANGFMLASRANPIIDARYNGMVAAGANVGNADFMKTFIATKRQVVLDAIAANNTSPFEITSNAGNDFSTSQNLITMTGRAPFEVAMIEVNGISYPVTWTTLHNWSLRVPLPPGTNTLSVIAYDHYGRPVAGATDSVRVTVTAPPAPPQDYIVINEVMFRPTTPDAEYVELFNLSTNVTFDLSNWRFNGLSYTFPEGTTLGPRAYLVLAKDRAAFAAAYGTNVVPHGVFAGNIQANGDTLTLLQPGATPAHDVVIDKVRFESALPWPFGAPDRVSSVQVIDARQDNARVGNWFGLSPLTTNSAWRFFSTNGVASGTGSAQQLLVYLGEPGEMYIDDIALVTGTVPNAGTNYVRNGDFEEDLYAPGVWSVATNYTNSATSTEQKHSGNASLRLVSTKFGNATNAVIYQALSPYPAGQTCTLSFWYLPTTTATNLYVRVRNTSLGVSGLKIGPQAESGPALFTPGAANATAAMLPAFPNLWINELLAENLSGLTDSAGEREPWIELVNAGTNTVSLAGLFLSTNYQDLTAWEFPPGASLAPGEFKVLFADGEPGETTSGEWHTTFRLAARSGSVALSRMVGPDVQVIDYVNYNAGPDHSFGSFPDAQPFDRQEFFHLTPGATNNGLLPPITVFINEWMADNVGALADPADANYEDWFEIYNPGTNAVSLGGYFLTDVLTNKFKYQIPAGYAVPPGGHLLVWADGEPGQNSAGRADLHADFSLARSGEAIGLFTPDGVQIDAVTFGAQMSDVAMGRFPDGSSSIYLLTNYTPRTANFYPQPNVPPTLAPIGNKTVFEGALLSFTVEASDSNATQRLTFSLEPGAPANAGINATNGVFTWVPDEADGGSTFPITVRVTDNGAPPMSATRSFNVTVLETNNAPALNVPGDSVVNEGATLTFTATATDADAPAQTLTFSLDPATAPAGASIHPQSGVFTWTPAEAQGPNAYTVVVRVSDNGTPPLSNSAPVSVLVNESNLPPVLGAITNRTVNIGEVVSFTASATDDDLPAQRLTFAFEGVVPAGAAIDADSGAFTWTANQSGTNTFTVRVTDHGEPALSATESFEIVVKPGLEIQSIAVVEGTVTLRWSAMAGRSYTVEYKNSLSDAVWSVLATGITATNSEAGTADAVGANAQRIYRIVLE